MEEKKSQAGFPWGPNPRRTRKRLAHLPERAEPAHVRAERAGGVGRSLAVTGQVPGMRVGRVVAVGGGVKVGGLVL